MLLRMIMDQMMGGRLYVDVKMVQKSGLLGSGGRIAVKQKLVGEEGA